ncbi:bifunctional phosphoribosylaminoimidazolecarboxamide formyltransferase/IMP cyclohydrolase [Limisalsivibrio acetivorans]|uniref:bifunctional phosphoribosylaminoimidazolecarboxamide formyltransferase/IMP cyclohydrolase n=1 Tax=Limisalsivibrio acetivorans TaxID=1304888 RepID=UPI0003B5CF73|nr:bifunctional phosphoribosylaminoimidazolecarboxamide formyltransferase/IMP cyclohydrolase [Limisalsivibrio acetivorans]
MTLTPKTALISVSDKTGVADFAAKLAERGVKIISTGGTAKLLRESGIDIVEIGDFTGFPEMLDGRVKTLHPRVHGGILNIRDNEEHRATMKEHGMDDIDMVVVNLYPFEKTVEKEGVELDEVIENIDIGGPSMVRSAAKNHKFVNIVVDTADYERVIAEMDNGGTTLETRRDLARKAYSHTALYDSIIANYFNRLLDVKFPEEFTLPARKKQSMRYGENPHQDSAFYTHPLIKEAGVSTGEQLQGKELSFNNIVDINAAAEIIKEFAEPAVTIIKHTNPCGTAVAEDVSTAYDLAFECDPVSAFGGIVGVNREVGADLAEKLAKIFLEVVVAPSFSAEAKEILSAKKNLRLIELGELDGYRDPELEMKKVTGGILLQDRDLHVFEDIMELNVPTKRKPTESEYKSLAFAWKVAKHVKSNAIIYANENQSIGVGAGQMSRVDSSKIAASKAQKPLKGTVMASDAFFPFRDSVDEAAANGITAIISPGGSIRDEEVIEAADEHGIAMVFTGIRHFKH